MRYIIGLHAVEQWVEKSPQGAVLYIAKPTKRNIAVKESAKRNGIKTQNIDLREMDRLCGGEEHKGILLGLPPEKKQKEHDLKTLLEDSGDSALFLLLDGITDPRNLGAILRSAEQFSADAVIIPERRSAADSPVVSKTSAGADALVPVISAVNLSRIMEEIKKYGFWIYGAAMEGISAAQVNLQGKTALVLGSEGSGLRQNIRNHCDELISIPTSGILDSLNVSVAAGILLYEVRRQQAREK